MLIFSNSDELEKAVNKDKDLIYPDDDIRIEFQTTESELNDIDCRSLFLCKIDPNDGGISERFDFVGRDIRCWGDFICRDFEGRCFDGGNFIGRDWKGRNGIMWNFEGRKVYYYAAFIVYRRFLCSEVYGTLENSTHKCLNEDIEYIEDEDFEYGIYSVY